MVILFLGCLLSVGWVVASVGLAILALERESKLLGVIAILVVALGLWVFLLLMMGVL